jgi:Holliday junction resolvase RusA-like endonuclease
MIQFFVEGDPKGQPRPRATMRGHHAGVYDPGTADEWKDAIVFRWIQSGIRDTITAPVRLIIEFRMPRPSRFTTVKGREQRRIPHTGKPDADNLAKSSMDALTRAGVWKDDAQVYRMEILKMYADHGEPSGALITITTSPEAS